jgi:hypothetical protein
MPVVLLCSNDAWASTVPLANTQVSSGWGRNAPDGAISRMAVRQGQPWSDSAWSPDTAEQVHSLGTMLVVTRNTLLWCVKHHRCPELAAWATQPPGLHTIAWAASRRHKHSPNDDAAH